MESVTGDDREIRAARNQAMFRAINEQLARNDALAATTGSHVIACECADSTCVQALCISQADYEAIRCEPRRFAVLAGHIYPDVETVVDKHRTYVVVEKLGEAAEIATALPPEAA